VQRQHQRDRPELQPGQRRKDLPLVVVRQAWVREELASVQRQMDQQPVRALEQEEQASARLEQHRKDLLPQERPALALASVPEQVRRVHHQTGRLRDQQVLQVRQGLGLRAEECRFQQLHPRHQTDQPLVVRRRDRWLAELLLVQKVQQQASCRQRQDFAALLVRYASWLRSEHRSVCSCCPARATEHSAESSPATCGQDPARVRANGR
jgi:hypothetical protein